MNKSFEVTTKGILKNQGIEVMAFDEDYAVGHQAGVTIIMHDNRIASNGDLTMASTAGRSMHCSGILERGNDPEKKMIYAKAEFPKSNPHIPAEIGDFKITYQVRVVGEGDVFKIILDLDKPLPEEAVGYVRFNMELYPGTLLGKPWIMDNKQGIFPLQPIGPVVKTEEMKLQLTRDDKPHNNAPSYDTLLDDGSCFGEALAVGHCLTILPDSEDNCLTIENKDAVLELHDARFDGVIGWFILTSLVPGGKTENALEWVVTPKIIEDWLRKPVIQISQVGYHPAQPKVAVVELDEHDDGEGNATLYKLTRAGKEKVGEIPGKYWGKSLRYSYLHFDFTNVTEEGMYQVCFRDSQSEWFRIAKDVYDRGVWQVVLEYYLPVQMCHMRVNDKNRMWHNRCHMDDAAMAPVDHIHIDGYSQGPSTLCKYKPGDHVPGLNIGGWHDAGDDDLRIESQAGECYSLACTYEEFNVFYDATTIDQEKRITEIHQPDGKNDIQQQIEHGLLSVVGAYRSLGRLYRGIIANDVRQYSLLGDCAGMTRNIIGDDDDRWVFTEDNPYRELVTSAELAASARAMRGYNDALAAETLDVAEELFAITDENREPEAIVNYRGDNVFAKIHAACELYLSTGKDVYKQYILSHEGYILTNIKKTGWIVAKVVKKLGEEKFLSVFTKALEEYKKPLLDSFYSTPYGVAYNFGLWGESYSADGEAFHYYYLQHNFPEIFPEDPIYNAINYELGCHPGSNNDSYVSGVGTKSATIAFGFNRADWTYIPGGVVPGTTLIHTDFPELKRYPFLWQQKEYVVGGGCTKFMFIVLAAKALLEAKT